MHKSVYLLSLIAEDCCSEILKFFLAVKLATFPDKNWFPSQGKINYPHAYRYICGSAVRVYARWERFVNIGRTFVVNHFVIDSSVIAFVCQICLRNIAYN